MRIVIGVLVLLILGAAGFAFYVSNQSLNEPPTIIGPVPTLEPIASSKVVSEGTGGAALNTNSQGFYDFYSQDGFGTSPRDKKVLFFFADWCPTCKTADADFQANLSKLPEDVAVFKVHYNDSQTLEEDKALANRYGITYQHTFVQVDNDGNEISKWNGGGLDNLLLKIK